MKKQEAKFLEDWRADKTERAKQTIMSWTYSEMPRVPPNEDYTNAALDLLTERGWKFEPDFVGSSPKRRKGWWYKPLPKNQCNCETTYLCENCGQCSDCCADFGCGDFTNTRGMTPFRPSGDSQGLFGGGWDAYRLYEIRSEKYERQQVQSIKEEEG